MSVSIKIRRVGSLLGAFLALLVFGAFQPMKAGGAMKTTISGPHPFGKTKSGEAAEFYTLTNKNGVVAKITNFGATLVELRVPDRNGKFDNVVLGFDDVAGYQSEGNQYFGCTVGRVCNRIAKGTFTLEGKTYKLALNNGPNHLHGGTEKSLDRVLWKVHSAEPGKIVFHFTSPDGEEGFPGTVAFESIYELTDANEIRLTFNASTDKATPVNLTNHSYFNLAGAGAATVLDHLLQVNADKYTPNDDTLIPLGKIEPVAGTLVDFREPTKLKERVEELAKTASLGIDHNFVLRKGEAKLVDAGTVRHPGSGRIIRVQTTQPALQVYTGNFLKGQKGRDGKVYPKQSAICLETQHFPDSVNQPSFPNTILRRGETYHHVCVYRFDVER